MNAGGDELAELIALLGADVAEVVRPHLSEESAAALRSIGSQNGSPQSRRKRKRLLAEFERMLQFVMAQGSPTPDPSGAKGAAKADEVVIADGSRAEEVLEGVPANRFILGVSGEHPRIIAVALDSLKAERVAELLPQLSGDVRPDVVKEMCKGVRVTTDVRQRVLDALVQKIRALPEEPPRNDDHFERLAEIIRATEKSVRKLLIAALEEQDPEAAARLNEMLYRFDDLVTLDDRAVQQILGQIDVGTLAAALSGADEEMSAKVMKNLSRRAADMLKEELQFSGRLSATRVEQAQSVIAKLIGKTEQEAE
jgi:flagellar motor switch protein FliG